MIITGGQSRDSGLPATKVCVNNTEGVSPFIQTTKTHCIVIQESYIVTMYICMSLNSEKKYTGGSGRICPRNTQKSPRKSEKSPRKFA